LYSIGRSQLPTRNDACFDICQVAFSLDWRMY